MCAPIVPHCDAPYFSHFTFDAGDPFCLHCHKPKAADAELFCSRECHEAYQRALAATLPPLPQGFTAKARKGAK